MVTASNITLADVITEDVTVALIGQREEELAHKSAFRLNPYGKVDPRAEYKKRYARMPLSTMLPYEEVDSFCEMATSIYQQFIQDIDDAPS